MSKLVAENANRVGTAPEEIITLVSGLKEVQIFTLSKESTVPSESKEQKPIVERREGSFLEEKEDEKNNYEKKAVRVADMEEEEEEIGDGEGDDDAGGALANNENDDDDFEDEIEGDEETTVDLGYAISASHPLVLNRRYFPSKIGGKPAWLNPRDLPPLSILTCSHCNNTLAFLLQIYAPLRDNGANLFHRTLFLFCCTNQTCLLKHEPKKPSLVLLRSQLGRTNSFYSFSPPPALPKLSKKKKSNSELIEDESYPGVSLCVVCGVRSSTVCGKCELTNYCSKEHQKRDWRLGHQQECQRFCALRDKEKKLNTEKESSLANQNISQSTTPLSASIPPNPTLIALRHRSLFPSFQLVIETEYIPPAEPLDDDSHTAELLSAYESAAAAGDVAGDDEFDGLGGSMRNKDKIYEKWRDRISYNPDQVVRYERGGEPLWVQRDKCLDSKRVPTCEYCKSERIFEFQILPQLLFYLEREEEKEKGSIQNPQQEEKGKEGGEKWEKEKEQNKKKIPSEASRVESLRLLLSQGLDWGTLSCYTCKESCGEGETQGYKREYVYLQPHGEE